MNNNPYPGLRPFSRNETNVFFGRDKHIKQLLDLLQETRFVSVTGLSGCGKSSLVHAGLIPSLEIAETNEWLILEMRPSVSPLNNLSQALIKQGSLMQENSLENVLKYFYSYGHLGLVRILQENLLSKKPTNVLLIVDQFEELFNEERISFKDKEFFVNLLLSSSEKRGIPIYIVITVRSETIGQCALFRGLTETINKGQFFVPTLTKQELYEAIVYPSKVKGRKVDEKLAKILLYDIDSIENHTDQLPILQHCLMRMWEKSKGHIELTLTNYRSVGKLEESISAHAEEIFRGFDEEKRWLTERIFRYITEKSVIDQLPTIKRRPAPLADIVTIAESDASEVNEVLNAFRAQACCFLIPEYDKKEKLMLDDIIDISHESFIRQWPRLNSWVKKEEKSANIYQELLKSATNWEGHKKHKEYLLGKLDLNNYLQWLKRDDKPSAIWAKRYGGNFDSVLNFIEHSKRKNLNRRIVLWAIVISITVLITKIIIQNDLIDQVLEEKAKTEEAYQIVEIEKKQALEAEKQAKDERKKAEETAQKAQRGQVEAQISLLNNQHEFKQVLRLSSQYLSTFQRHREFVTWGEKNSIPLIPLLQIMIESSESFTEEQKQIWQNDFSTMTEEQRNRFFKNLRSELLEP